MDHAHKLRISPAVASGEGANAKAPERLAGAPSFDEVYATYFHQVARWSRAFGGLEADLDDLGQEVFMVVRRKLHQYRGPSLPAWLYGITRKTVSDYRRRAWLRRLLSGVTRSLSSEPEAAAAETDPGERMHRRRVLARVLDAMTPMRRSTFILFEIEGLSGSEIAALEQVPVKTVYTRLHHARRDFVRLVADLEGEGEGSA